MPDKRRLDYIDALRGFACLWVILHHAFEGERTLPKLLGYFCDIGWLGVSLFLVLSGFCLYYPLVRRQAPETATVPLKSFFQRRARRILPPYYLSLVVALVFAARFLHQNGQSLTGLTASWYDLPLHLLLLHNLTATTFASLSSVTWSLALEWQLYLIFPVLVALAARRGFHFLLVATLAIGLLWQGIAACQLGVSRVWLPSLAVVYHALPGRVFEFTCGMLAALLVARPVPGQHRKALLIGGICLVPALTLVLFFYRLGPFCDPLWGVVFASALVALSNTTPRHRLARALVSIGERSYSIYLIHLLVMLALPLPGSLAGSPVLAGLLRSSIALLAGLAFFTVAERPFLQKNNPRPAMRGGGFSIR